MDTHRKGFYVSLEEGGAGKSFESHVCVLFPLFIRGRALGYEICLGCWSTGLQWYSHKVWMWWQSTWCLKWLYPFATLDCSMILLTLTACLFKLERKNKEALLMPNQHSVKASGGVKLNFLILNLCSECWEASGQFHALAILPTGKELLDRTG